MRARTLTSLFFTLILAGSIQAAMRHQYAFDGAYTDSGTIGLDLVEGAAAALDTDVYLLGAGAVRLTPSLATDARPADVPANVPPSGVQTHGWDGPSTYTNINPDVDFASGDVMTIATWILADEVQDSANPTLVSFGATGIDGGRMDFRLMNRSGNWVLRNEVANGSAYVDSPAMNAKIAGLTTLSNRKWHHVAMVIPVDPAAMSNVVFYIDGVVFSGATGDGGDITFGTPTREYVPAEGPIHVGDSINDGNRDFAGWLDDVRIYDEAIDAAAVLALYNDGLANGEIVSNFQSSKASILVGERVDLSWFTFNADSVSIDQGVGVVTGQDAVTVQPAATTTYTLTGNRGGLQDTRQVTVTVQTTPDVFLSAAPPVTDGSQAVTLSWNCPTVIEQEDHSGTVTAIAGTTVTDAETDFDATLTMGSNYRFLLNSELVSDSESLIDTWTGNTVTLVEPIGTTLNPDLAPIPTKTSGNERSYVADAPDHEDTGLLDGTRWLNAVNPGGFTGTNGAAEFEDPTGTVMSNSTVVVNDPLVPGITEAYDFGPSIGKARAWYGGTPPHDALSSGDATFEVWFKPNDLTSGPQIIFEAGGNGFGTYISLDDNVIAFHVNGKGAYTLDSFVFESKWTQVVGVMHNSKDDQANDYTELYIDGIKMNELIPVADINDWAGSDDAGFGGVEGTYAGAGPISGANETLFFNGQIAVVRMYDRAFTKDQVEHNYLAVSRDESLLSFFLDNEPYSINEILGADTLTLDDDDPATGSPLFTTGDIDVIASGVFTTAVVTVDTLYTATATITGSGSSQAQAAVDVDAAGTSYAATVLNDGPVGYYRLDEVAGSPQAFDSSGNNLHSTGIIGSIDFGETGAINAAARFNGNETLTVGVTLDPSIPTGWSLETLVRPVTAANGFNQHIASNTDGGGTGRSMLFLGGAGRVTSYIGVANRTGTDLVFDEAWSHVVMTTRYVDATNHIVRFYLDGMLDAEFTGIVPEFADGPWRLGSHKIRQANNFLVGLLDEVSFYDYPLDDPNSDGATDDSRVAAHLDAYLADTPHGLLAYGGRDDEGDSDQVVGPSGAVRLVSSVGGSAMLAEIRDSSGTLIDVLTPGAVSTTLVSPVGEETYTLNIDGVMQSVTVRVLEDVLLDSLALDLGVGQAMIGATNLIPGVAYDLWTGPDLNSLTNLISNQVAPATTVDTFDDAAAPAEVNFYGVKEVPPPLVP